MMNKDDDGKVEITIRVHQRTIDYFSDKITSTGGEPVEETIGQYLDFIVKPREAQLPEGDEDIPF